MTIRYEQGYACVESYEFYRFIQEVQEVTSKGYVLDLSNSRFPTQYVGYWTAYFNKTEEATTPAATVNAQSPEVATQTPVAPASPDNSAAVAEAITAVEKIAEDLKDDGKLNGSTSPTKTEEEAPRRRGRPPQNR